MDADYEINLAALQEVIDDADVFVIRFDRIEQRLLVDARQNNGGEVFIQVVPPVTSGRERYRYLEQARPGMPAPEQITVFQWRQSVQVLKNVGLWKRLEERFFELGGVPAVQQVNEAFTEAFQLEQTELVGAIRGGEGWETIWERDDLV
ncbi:MAG: hypothetical protein O3A10_09195 [Chloroflexi bacterium]|nr:hypothetical protein [Chloroflexota bacterium]MDA1146636.1 hypothetical protein [Chloroflexota bacterium]MQC82822.1 hypothetical protein [Chloroflexota bacterium]